MPIGILNINTRLVRKLPKAAQLEKLINNYFKSVNTKTKATARSKKSRNLRETAVPQPGVKKSITEKSEPDPPTLTGLALYLGFISLEEFEEYEQKKYFGRHLKRAKLLIIAAYEKKLHNTYTSGPIFALRCLGWHPEKTEEKQSGITFTTKTVIVNEFGLPLAASEKEVML